MAKRYYAKYLPEEGTYFDGNVSYSAEAKVPTLVDAATAKRLKEVKVVFTSYSPDGKIVPLSQPSFEITEVDEDEDAPPPLQHSDTPLAPVAPAAPPEGTITTATARKRPVAPPPAD